VNDYAEVLKESQASFQELADKNVAGRQRRTKRPPARCVKTTCAYNRHTAQNDLSHLNHGNWNDLSRYMATSISFACVYNGRTVRSTMATMYNSLNSLMTKKRIKIVILTLISFASMC